MPRPSFPKTLRQFQLRFANEKACQQYLTACRWPEGFKCPRCAHIHGYALTGRRLWECAACGHQVSLTSGTVLHNTKTPLTVWFWAVAAFQTLLGLGTGRGSTPYDNIRGARDLSKLPIQATPNM